MKRFLPRTRRKSTSHMTRSGIPRPSASYVAPLLIILMMWVLSIFILQWGNDLRHSPLSEGQRAPLSVVAEVDFESVDLAFSDIARRQMAEAVAPVFAINDTMLQTQLRALDQFIDRVILLRTAPEAPETDNLEIAGVNMRIPDAMALFPAGHEEAVRKAFRHTLELIWNQGIISNSEKESFFHGVASAGRIAIRQGELPPRSPVDVAQLQTTAEALQTATKQLLLDLPPALNVPIRPAQMLIRALIQPNLRYDFTATDALRLAAQREVKPALQTIRAGATLINQGDRISAQQIENWRAHERRMSELQTAQDKQLRLAGEASLLLFALVICAGLLQILRPDVVQSKSRVLLLVLLALISLLSTKGLFFLSNTTTFVSPNLVEFMVPLALAPLLTTVLIGPATAVVIGVWTSFSAAVIFDNSFSIFAMGLLVSIIVAHTTRDVSKRSRIFRVGLWVGVSQLLYGASLAVLSQLQADLAFMQAGTSLITGMITALLALILLPFFEAVFDITTDITLLELSDMGHPLLQRLAIEAPGTYHHSLMVANLAQAAASEIRANALLVRVCAYFHDIGKLTKPEFFVENSQYRENPHDDLAPTMSTLVIISHVKEGVSMAHRYRLPNPIIEAIEQHHGTSLVLYFYHRAKTEQAKAVDGGREINEGDFRYPGPKPRTREMGILLLADSVEAASRSMEKPTPGRIEGLVDDIITSRLQDDQLDDCDLTFAQLKAIKRSFIFTLTNTLHGRVPYPKDENRNKQSTEKKPDQSAETKELRPLAPPPSTGA